MIEASHQLRDAAGEHTATRSGARKPYAAPAIVYESELETRAGSPLGANPFGQLGLDLPEE